ncbi:hypothetical protein MAPG_10677, partial [Magnaporthiopsis poae ATCC 64411]
APFHSPSPSASPHRALPSNQHLASNQVIMAGLPPWYNILESGAVDRIMKVLSIARVGEPVSEPELEAGGVPHRQRALPQTRDENQRLEGPYWPLFPLLEPMEIRVLELKPGSGEDEIRCSLHHCSLDVPIKSRSDAGPETDAEVLRLQGKFVRGEWHKPAPFIPKGFIWEEPYHALLLPAKLEPVPYTALSYTWGPNVFNASIELDGYTKPVIVALEKALRHFRRPDTGLVMWIDQLCINQTDKGEKERQIPLMGRIYAQFFNTLVWLGDLTPGSGETVKLLKRIVIKFYMDPNPLDIPADFSRRLFPGLKNKA